MSKPDWKQQVRDLLGGYNSIMGPDGPLFDWKLVQALESAYRAGIEKAVSISEYHSEKYGEEAHPAWVAACNEIIVSCRATNERLLRGQDEDPSSPVMALPIGGKDGGG